MDTNHTDIEHPPYSDSVATRAVEAFSDGDPILVYDVADREGEVDIVYPAGAVDANAVERMRTDAGGLVCVALSDDACETLRLPFLRDAIDHPVAGDDDIGYGDRSATSFSVNHTDTFTGITDNDRALTIRCLATVASDPDLDEFADQFRAPGHVRLLRAAPGLLAERRGHTEIGVAIALAANRPPAAVVCEMLDDETGDALPRSAARAYAEREGLVYAETADLVDALA